MVDILVGVVVVRCKRRHEEARVRVGEVLRDVLLVLGQVDGRYGWGGVLVRWSLLDEAVAVDWGYR